MAQRDPMRIVWLTITGVTLVFGWIFILWQNKFHVDAPVVVVMLAYLAVVMTVTNLWRVGAATVAPQTSDDTWGRPLGERGTLEKEKKSLLKSIKDAEFDQAMGKLSKTDADQLIQMYRARAIEVIKELDRLEAGQADTPRQKIEREVAARVLVAKQTADNRKLEKAKAEKSAEKTDKKSGKATAKAAKADDNTDADKPVEPAVKLEQTESAEAASTEEAS